MRTYTLLGRDISYSASPAIQHAALAQLGLPHRYVIADVPEDEFPDAVARLRGTTGGANVTIPYKEDAYRLVDECSEEAAVLRAVNTIVVDGDRLIGHNTDLPAIEDELRALVPSGPRHAVVIGAGGASRAVQAALFNLDAAVTVAQRRDGSLDRVEDYLAHADLVVNTTPIGTGTNELPIAADLLRPNLAVFDLTYRPSPTALVRAALEAGAPARTGGGMLVGQAWRSLALWLESDGVSVGPEVAPAMMEALRVELEA